MNKYKYLLKNIGLLTLSSFATKLLSFFLVPLYTNILTTTEYGIYDLFTTTIGVLLPILTLNIQESIMRFSLEKKYTRQAIVTIGTRYFIISNMIVLGALILNSYWGLNRLAQKYAIFFFLMFLSQSLSGMLMSYVRGVDKIADLSISSVIASFVTIGCNLFFLVGFRWGLVGYFVANIIGPMTQCIYLIIKTHMLSDINLQEPFEKEKKAMLAYCKPLIANSIAWWVNNVSDRYVIIFFCGLAENGIYSVAGKIPSILNIFQGIFNSAWTLSAVRDFDPEDKNGFFANTYSAYNCMMVIICSAIITTDKFLANFLYAKDFYLAWKYVPWLTIAILFGALSGYLGGFFSAVKDSKIFATSTIVGAITNLILNFIFTPYYGAMGAAVATAICYFVVWGFRYLQSKKYIQLKVHIKRDIVSYVMLGIQAIVLLKCSMVLQVICFILIVVLYLQNMRMLVSKGFGMRK